MIPLHFKSIKMCGMLFYFAGLNINEIGLILDETTNYTLEAFVLFATNRDFDMALKRNWEFMGNRFVHNFNLIYVRFIVQMRKENAVVWFINVRCVKLFWRR